MLLPGESVADYVAAIERVREIHALHFARMFADRNNPAVAFFANGYVYGPEQRRADVRRNIAAQRSCVARVTATDSRVYTALSPREETQ